MLCQEHEGPCQNQGRAFVAGQEKGHGFVTNLPVSHALPIFSATRPKQHRQQITVIHPTGTPGSNHVIDDSLQSGNGTPLFDVIRQPAGQWHQRSHLIERNLLHRR